MSVGPLKRSHLDQKLSSKRPKAVNSRETDCPICLNTFDAAFITPCGHSFCFSCVKQCLEKNRNCPTCGVFISHSDSLIPNKALDNLVRQHGKGTTAGVEHQTLRTKPKQILELTDQLGYEEMSYVVKQLAAKLVALDENIQKPAWHDDMLREFLERVEQDGSRAVEDAQEKLHIVRGDLKLVQSHGVPTNSQDPELPSTSQENSMFLERFQARQAVSSPTQTVPSEDACVATAHFNETSDFKLQAAFSNSQYWHTNAKVETPASLRRRLQTHHADLKDYYYKLRQGPCEDGIGGYEDGLERFSETLTSFYRFSAFRTLASFSYEGEFCAKNFVSSIEFDRDQHFFATAGVSKKIKIYDYHAILANPMFDHRYPEVELYHLNKISSLSWNPYHKSMLASCDYDGKVCIWDTSAMKRLQLFQEHQERAWSVDFNNINPHLLASASDDMTVRLWQTGVEHSVGLARAPSNVCCVTFHPKMQYHFAMACIDHYVHYYDMRNMDKPLFVLRGHDRAVSYCKFISDNEVVSASTDGQLKLWSLDKHQCLRSFSGHVNDLHFVGMATNGPYIVCGSEDNAIYIYMKSLTKPLLKHQFDGPQTLLNCQDRREDATEFVSAVCWRKGYNVVVAANSTGNVKIFELV